jgi:mannitol/fructose-specific phosphotransferase system IIA component (Ntr-type)
MPRFTRHLRAAQVKLELEAAAPVEFPEGWSRERRIWSVKERALAEIADLLDASGRVANRTKLLADLVNRERKATTAIGGGIAIPHVRTMQARDFALCLARSGPGVEFDAPDGELVHIFVGVVAPPYDDRLYLEVYREIGTLLSRAEARAAILGARDAHEVVKAVLDLER